MQKIMISVIHITLILAILVAGLPTVNANKSIRTNLSFEGTTATCSVKISAEKSTDNIVVSVQLYQGTTLVSEWNDVSGKGTFSFSETATVKKGKSYTMKTKCTINGKSQSVADVTKKCK